MLRFDAFWVKLSGWSGGCCAVGRVGLVLGMGLMLVGCVGGLRRDKLQSLVAEDRMRAARERASCAQLVELLSDGDAIVRMSAIDRLEKMSGDRFGYDASKPGEDQGDALVRWQRWCERRGEVMP